MNTFGKSVLCRLLLATIVAALLCIPLVSGAQSGNTAYGYDTLFSNTTGFNNSAFGYDALALNKAGYDNVANGSYALCNNSAGSYNTADGSNALAFNTMGYDNAANGYATLYANTNGSYNAASGFKALFYNSTGDSNTANGFEALFYNSAGNYNTAVGNEALYNCTGSNNIALGNAAGEFITTGNNNIAIGNIGSSQDNGVLRIGTAGSQTATYIAGINGVTVSGGVAVYVNTAGQLGTLTSSRRFKNDIKDMGTCSERLMRLRPVTFRYKDTAEHGPHHLQYGLIAEEVAKVFPDLVQYDKQGKPFTIYYHLLTPMLLNELQREHRQNEAEKTEITALKAAYRVDVAELRAAHNAEITALKSELTALKSEQEHQRQVLAKLADYARIAPNKGPLHNAVFAQH